MILTVRLSAVLLLTSFFLCACGPFVVTETAYDADGEVGSETVQYNDGGPPRVLSESGAVPDSAISNSDVSQQDDMGQTEAPE